MKHISCLNLSLILVLLAGCVLNSPLPDSTASNTQTPEIADATTKPRVTPMKVITKIPTVTATSTFTRSSAVTPTLTSTTTQTPTMTPPPTLEPDRAKETLEVLLVEPVDCEAPCFWGVVPGQTTLGEAKNIFDHLGLKESRATVNKKESYTVEYEFDPGPSIIVTLRVQDDLVKNLRIKISPEIYQAGILRAWLAYSPETLITRYGTPSRVEFWVGRSATSSGQYTIEMYFKAVDLIVQYFGYDIPVENETYRVCPLSDNFDLVSIWLGKNPVDPPLNKVSLEEASSMTLEEFAELMTGDTESACINLKYEAFSQ